MSASFEVRWSGAGENAGRLPGGVNEHSGSQRFGKGRGDVAAVSDGVPKSGRADFMANGHDNGGGRRLQRLNARIVDVFGSSVDEADCDCLAVGVEMGRVDRSSSGWKRRRGWKGGSGDFRVGR